MARNRIAQQRATLAGILVACDARTPVRPDILRDLDWADDEAEARAVFTRYAAALGPGFDVEAALDMLADMWWFA